MAIVWTLILAVLTPVAALLGIMLSKQATDEFKAWLPWVLDRIVERAVGQLPKDQRDRYSEEWRGHLAQVPGDIGKLVVAFGFLKASREMSPFLSSLSYAISKRTFDICFSIIGLFIVFPVLLVTAIAIKLDSPGPVLFWTQRRDFRNRRVHLLKFRTMAVVEDDTGASRVTRVGNIIRRMSIDAMPQLINVLRGEMSLVGPRLMTDERYETVQEYDLLPSADEISDLKSGMTGWAQIADYTDMHRAESRFVAGIQNDLYYAEHRSFLLDLKIVGKSLWAALVIERER